MRTIACVVACSASCADSPVVTLAEIPDLRLSVVIYEDDRSEPTLPLALDCTLRVAVHSERDDDFVFVIEETDVLRRPVGQVSLYRVDWPGGRAEYGRLMIGEEEARGLGLARRVTQILIDHAFGPMGLRELYLECLSDNDRALAVYADTGFKVVGERGPLTLMAIQHVDTVGP